MADIVIRGMEMPENCRECRFAGSGGVRFELNVCMFSGESQSLLSQERMSKCPLLPLPEGHGRLVDADALESIIGGFSLNWEYGQGVSDCWDALISAPTILEAEGGGGE